MSAATTLPAVPERNAPPPARPRPAIGVVRTLDDAIRLADVLVRSGMLPQSIRTAEAATAIMLKGMELGIGVMHAFDGISVIQGKPTVSPQLMLALIEESGKLQDMQVEESPPGSPLWCRISMTRRGRSPQAVAFDEAEAKAMGLFGKDNWRKQPGVMCYWRCVAKACRRVFPDIIAGCYTPDEMGADVGEEGEIVEAGAWPASGPAPAERAAPPAHANGSGHGRGQYAPDEKAAEYRAWLSAWIDERNAGWLDSWNRARTYGEFPAAVKDLLNPWQVNAHMVKWGVDSGRLDPKILPEDLKARQRDNYPAVMFFRAKDQAAFIGELDAYAAKQADLQREKVYRAHPDLRPAEERGDPGGDDDIIDVDPDDDAFEPGRE